MNLFLWEGLPTPSQFSENGIFFFVESMADKMLHIPNNAQNYHFCRLKLVVEMFEYST